MGEGVGDELGEGDRNGFFLLGLRLGRLSQGREAALGLRLGNKLLFFFLRLLALGLEGPGPDAAAPGLGHSFSLERGKG